MVLISKPDILLKSQFVHVQIFWTCDVQWLVLFVSFVTFGPPLKFHIIAVHHDVMEQNIKITDKTSFLPPLSHL